MERDPGETRTFGTTGHAGIPAGRWCLLPDGIVTLQEDFLPGCDADRMLARLLAEVAWEQHHVRLFGRVVPSPRLSAWYGDPGAVYRYSGMTLQPRAWTPLLRELRDRVVEAVGAAFNSVLLNRYRDGRDAMGWHADDEPELGEEPVIASVSLGATRVMAFRHRGDPALRRRIELRHGSLLIMAGPTQSYWRHALPRMKGVADERVNLTFRFIHAQRGCGATRKEPGRR